MRTRLLVGAALISACTSSAPRGARDLPSSSDDDTPELPAVDDNQSAADDADAADDTDTSDEADAGVDPASTDDAAPDGSDGADDPEGAVTYHRDVRPLLERHCVACHTTGGLAPFALDSWKAVSPWAPACAIAVARGTMPPWPASAACRPQRDAARLDEAERALFAAWSDAGFPEGRASSYTPPSVSAPGPTAEAPDRVLDWGTPYAPPTSASDEYRCFPVAPAFAEDTYLTAVDILPGQRSLVHHVVVFQVPQAGAPRVAQKDAADAALGYQCFGGVDVPGAQNLVSYRPGARALSLGPGDAIYVPKGAQLVIQMHYNTLRVPAGAAAPADLTRVALWTLPTGTLPDRIVARNQAIALFTIPAGAADVPADSSTALSSLSAYGTRGLFGAPSYVQGEIIGMTPHMHQLGTRIGATLKRASGEEECLVEVPRWDFGWQIDYLFAEPLAYAPGDHVELRCRFDNSPGHQPVVQGVPGTPREVRWGEGSADEMCLSHVWFRYPRASFLAAIR